MNFTKELPTRPGAYWWRADDGDECPTICEVAHMEGAFAVWFVGELECEPTELIGGEWCELVPRDEVVPKGEIEKAWQESRMFGLDGRRTRMTDWHDSRAKRVMEGKE